MKLPSPRPFLDRHVGPSADDVRRMLSAIAAPSLDALVGETVPASIRLAAALDLPPARTESEALEDCARLGAKNQRLRSFLGMGYHDTVLPPVIQRNILENPGWYTAYTPYQAEISQGRLEALLNFQQMIMDLTGFDVAGASLLDEATAAAEAMQMFAGIVGDAREDVDTFFVSELCHPQTIAVLRGRAEPRAIKIVVGDHRNFSFGPKVFGALVQYPATDGAVFDYRAFCAQAHAAGSLVAVAADPLSLALLTPPAELGADAAVGSAQRFGVPMGFGGPHAGYVATRATHTRRLPGRLIGVSQDAQGRTALRMALQTREQHIRREKATSNICTAQVLLAVIAGMYAVWHGPSGIKAIAERVARLASALGRGLRQLGVRVADGPRFDTIRIDGSPADVTRWLQTAAARGINLRRLSPTALTIAFDETTTPADVATLLEVLAPPGAPRGEDVDRLIAASDVDLPDGLRRTSAFLTHAVFNTHHSETEMLRYMRRLESRDISLTHSMIPLGSCTMKLNATAEMMPVTSPDWAKLHPFVPPSQAEGYHAMFRQLERMLATVTGFPAVSLQPNAGSQGELAGLLVIRKHHSARGEGHRDICLIPQSAHGTNPASAVMAGYRVVVVRTDDRGNVDVADLEAKAREHADRLAALMITYPSTHGVFEEQVRRICEVVHAHGGQVYMDGANLNAQVGLTRPGEIGADVCHLNLHKTFCIPHGGGGPGMGPIAVAAHLAPYLPGHPVVATGGAQGIDPISAAPWGSASILLISWMYVTMMGADGLTHATKIAILNANYVARRLEPHYPVVYKGEHGRVAHECILDLRPFKKSAGIEAEDVAKRLMDYGFHAPTMSFPIPGTLMVEPTESESLAELDRFCEAMIAIRAEIAEIEAGTQPREDNLLKNAPHTADALLVSEWPRPYPRERAAFPLPWVRTRKYWPPVGRINNTFGDRNFVCACPSIESYGA